MSGFTIFILVPLLSYLTIRAETGTGEGSERMVSIGKEIQTGASAFLKTEFTYLAFFVVITSAVIAGIRQNGLLMVAFIIGSCLSALCGYIGMSIAVRGM